MAKRETVQQYLTRIGRTGGLKKSANKTAAARLNARKPRPRRKVA